ncbi:hypothetical protein TKK_0005490 [Trichogramma kaykai]
MNSSGLTPNLTSTNNLRVEDSESSEKPSSTVKFMNRIKAELIVDRHHKHINNELHQKRVQNLRKELDYLKSTEWKYQPTDRYL